MFYQCLDRLGLLALVAIETAKHLLEGPLGPMVITWITSSYLTIPIEAETYFVQLTTITVDVFCSGNSWMLSCLDSVLLSWQAVSIVTHGVQYIKALLTLEASIDV